MTEPPADRGVGERLARIETDIGHIKDESRAIRSTLHSLLTSTMADHSAAITRLAAAHDQRQGIWWTVAWVSGVLLVLAGGIGWLLENQVQVIIKK